MGSSPCGCLSLTLILGETAQSIVRSFRRSEIPKMDLWKSEKKLGAKKAEKSLEISAFLVFSRSDLNRPKDLAHPYKIDPQSKFFRNRSVFFDRWIDLSLGDDGSCT